MRPIDRVHDASEGYRRDAAECLTHSSAFFPAQPWQPSKTRKNRYNYPHTMPFAADVVKCYGVRPCDCSTQELSSSLATEERHEYPRFGAPCHPKHRHDNEIRIFLSQFWRRTPYLADVVSPQTKPGRRWGIVPNREVSP